jgi:hypothetical protein
MRSRVRSEKARNAIDGGRVRGVMAGPQTAAASNEASIVRLFSPGSSEARIIFA